MRRLLFLFFILWSLSTLAREQLLLISWKFHLGDVPEAVRPSFDDRSWERVRVPHDWAISHPFDMRVDMQSVQVLEDGDEAPKCVPGVRGLCRLSESDTIGRRSSLMLPWRERESGWNLTGR